MRAFSDAGKGYSRGASLGHVDELPRKCSYTIKGTSRTICVKAYYRCWICIDFNCMRKISGCREWGEIDREKIQAEHPDFQVVEVRAVC